MGKYKLVSFLFVLLGLILIAGAAYMIISYPTTSILPFMYIGIPLAMIIVSILMFMGGAYYHKGKFDDEAQKHGDLERQVVHKLVQKINRPGPAGPPAMEEASGIPPDEDMAPPEDAPAEDVPEEASKPSPAKPAKPAKKRK